jgi:hypothetical protein
MEEKRYEEELRERRKRRTGRKVGNGVILVHLYVKYAIKK